MKKPLDFCINGDGRPVQRPSWVLCLECLTGFHDALVEMEGHFPRKGKIPEAKPEPSSCIVDTHPKKNHPLTPYPLSPSKIQ